MTIFTESSLRSTCRAEEDREGDIRFPGYEDAWFVQKNEDSKKRVDSGRESDELPQTPPKTPPAAEPDSRVPPATGGDRVDRMALKLEAMKSVKRSGYLTKMAQMDMCGVAVLLVRYPQFSAIEFTRPGHWKPTEDRERRLRRLGEECIAKFQRDVFGEGVVEWDAKHRGRAAGEVNVGPRNEVEPCGEGSMDAILQRRLLTKEVLRGVGHEVKERVRGLIVRRRTL